MSLSISPERNKRSSLVQTEGILESTMCFADGKFIHIHQKSRILNSLHAHPSFVFAGWLLESRMWPHIAL